MNVFLRFLRLLTTSAILLVLTGQHGNVKGQDRGPKGVSRIPGGSGRRGGSRTTTSFPDSAFANLTERTLTNITDLCPETPNDSSTTSSATCVVESGYFDETDYAGYVIIPLFLVLGLFGNTMTIIVMSTRRFRQAACSLVLIFLLCSDTAFILTQPWNKPWITDLVGVDIRALSEVGCKIFFVFLRTAKMSSSWLLVLVCFERFAAVCFNFHAKTIFTKCKITIGIAVIYVIMFAYTGACSVFSAVTMSGECDPYIVEGDTAIMGRAFAIVGTSLYAVIPTIFLLITTPIIVYELYQQKQQRRETAHSEENKPADTLGITAIYLGIATAYVILVSPMWIGKYVAYAMGETLFQSTNSILEIFRQVAQPLEQLNYCIKFFLCILCSRAFRKQVAQLLGCARCSRKEEGIISGTKMPSQQQQTSELYKRRAAAVEISIDSGCGVLENDLSDQKEQPEAEPPLVITKEPKAEIEPPVATEKEPEAEMEPPVATEKEPEAEMEPTITTNSDVANKI